MAIDAAKMERDWSWSGGCFGQQKEGDDSQWGDEEEEPELWSSSSGGYQAAVDRWSQQGEYREVELEPIVLAGQPDSWGNRKVNVNSLPPPVRFPPSSSPPIGFHRDSSPSFRRWKQFKHAGRNLRRRLYSRYIPHHDHHHYHCCVRRSF